MKKSALIAIVEEYTGKHILPHTIEISSDPVVVGAYAIRWQRTRKEAVDFLYTPDGLEEVEFTQWPPRSR